ncbi:rod shape-determining protein MreC, partial [bacterium]
ALGAGGLVYLSRSGAGAPNPTWYQGLAQRVVSPVAQVFSGVAARLRGFSEGYLQWRGDQQLRLELEAELAALREEALRLREENRGLKAEAGIFAENGLNESEGRPARVIGYDPIPAFRSITIDRGSDHGVAPDQVVVAGGGVVGRVMRAGGRSSQVLLVTDLNSAVDVVDARTRARGLLVGKRKDMGLKRERWMTQAEYVSASEEIVPGDLLLTSGLDGVFPKGLPVGVVGAVKKDPSGLFWQAEVDPYVELNKLEEVLVLAPKEGGEG